MRKLQGPGHRSTRWAELSKQLCHCKDSHGSERNYSHRLQVLWWYSRDSDGSVQNPGLLEQSLLCTVVSKLDNLYFVSKHWFVLPCRAFV
jgi:hypothetical protein